MCQFLVREVFLKEEIDFILNFISIWIELKSPNVFYLCPSTKFHQKDENKLVVSDTKHADRHGLAVLHPFCTFCANIAQDWASVDCSVRSFRLAHPVSCNTVVLQAMGLGRM
jgi:hypothetical protein